MGLSIKNKFRITTSIRVEYMELYGNEIDSLKSYFLQIIY